MGLVGRSTRGLLCGTAVALVAVVGAANAQDEQANGEQVTVEAEKKGRVTQLQRLVIGAGQEKVAIDTPQAVSVIEQEDLDSDQPATIGDVIREIPGVNVTGSDRLLGQNFNIRGIGAPETTGDGLVSTVMGVPVV